MADEELPAQSLSQGADAIRKAMQQPQTGTPPLPTLPSGMNPLWRLAARMNNVNPYTGEMMPNAPQLFQQGPMQLPPVPPIGMPPPQSGGVQ